jgi:hypothetical protein
MGSGCERATYLEDPDRSGVALGIENEFARQLRRRRETIDARRERHSTQILTSQVDTACLAGQSIVRAGDVTLSASRNDITGVDRSCDRARREAGDRATGGADTQALVTVELARTVKLCAEPSDGATAPGSTMARDAGPPAAQRSAATMSEIVKYLSLRILLPPRGSFVSAVQVTPARSG